MRDPIEARITAEQETDAAASTATESIATASGRVVRKSGRARLWTIRIVTFVVVMGAWQTYASFQNRALIATPLEIVQAGIGQFAAGTIWEPLGISLLGLITGLLFTFPIGVALGILVGRSRLAEYLLDPFISFLYVLPGIALIPILVLWLGFDFKLRLALVFLAAVFPLIINTANGVKNVDSELIDGAVSFNASRWQLLATVIIPGAFPFMLAGLRVSFGAAWVSVIVAEMTALITGMGGLVVTFANLFKTADLFVPIVLIMFIGIVVNLGMNRLYRRFGDWDNRGREA